MAGRTLALSLALLTVTSCAGRASEPAVRFWAFGREGEVVRQLLPEFERRNPGVRVSVQQVPWTAAHEKLLTAFVGRATPDITQLGNTWIPEFVALGALAPLDDRLAASAAIDRGDYFEGSWASNIVDRTTWGVPWYVDTRLLFYRSDLIKASGARWPPRTWSQWREAMIRVKALGQGTRYAILVPVDEWDKPIIFGMQAGSPLLSQNGTRGSFRDPAFHRALKFYLGLFESGLAAPLTESGVANLYQQLAQGYFAMLITGPWNLGEFRRRLPPDLQDDWATAPLPAPDESNGYPGASIAGGASLVMFRGAAGNPHAWRLMEFLSEPAQQARFFELSGNLPARRSVWEATGLNADPRAAAFRAQLLAARPLPKVPEWEQIANRVAERTEEAVRGRRGFDDTLSIIDADVDRILAKRRSLLARAAQEDRR